VVLHGRDKPAGTAAVRALVELGLHAGRRRNDILDPKGFQRYERKVALAGRRRPRRPVLRIDSGPLRAPPWAAVGVYA
jgi:hypothetical protein